MVRLSCCNYARIWKLVATVTDISKCGIEHQANLFRKASLHAVDRFFMNARRAVGLLERSFSSG